MKEISHRLTPKQSAPAPPLMLVAIVEHVTALAEGREVGVLVVRGVVVAMGSGQHHLGNANVAEQVLVAQPLPELATLAVTPTRNLRIPPATVTEVKDPLKMWPAALITPALRSAEADDRRELGPVDRIEEAVLPPDRHPCSSARALQSSRRVAEQIVKPSLPRIAKRENARVSAAFTDPSR
ncbi:hypothetical protein G4G93_25650 [Methylobacterium sp. DB0501]|nr:hypothetical protein [Methylobacterium sp. DB0501]